MDEDMRAFCRRCVAARSTFQAEAVRSLPVPRLREIALRLGLPVEHELTQVSEYELAFAFDVGTYTAPPGRSRAIDRVARRYAGLRTEAALVLNALTRSWFSVFRVVGQHPDGGLLLEDLLRGGEAWVVDEVLAEHSTTGGVLATRLGRVRGFAMTCGVVAVLDETWAAKLREVVRDGGLAEDLANDIRFMEAIWRHALGFQGPRTSG